MADDSDERDQLIQRCVDEGMFPDTVKEYAARWPLSVLQAFFTDSDAVDEAEETLSATERATCASMGITPRAFARQKVKLSARPVHEGGTGRGPAQTTSLSATEQHMCRATGISPERFAREKARLARAGR